jgi:hypothetical protein
MSGRHYEKVSVTNQYCHRGFALINDIKDSHISVMAMPLEELYRKSELSQPYVILDLQNSEENSVYTLTMRSLYVTNSIIFLLKDPKEIGILEIQFDDDSSIDELEKKVKLAEPYVVEILYQLKRSGSSWFNLKFLLEALK